MVAISLNNPWITGDHVSLQSTLYNKFSDNPFYEYRYHETDFSLKADFTMD